MPIVAGVDFGTLSVRVTLLDSAKGKAGHSLGELCAASPAGGSGLRDAIA